MQERLALPAAAQKIAWFAMPLDLLHVSPHGPPPFDLATVFFRHAPAQVIAAVPLKPAARLIGMDPPPGAPFRKRLACVDAEEVEPAVAAAGCQLGTRKPALGEFLAAVGHVLAAEYAKSKHVLRRQVGLELRIEVAPDRRRQAI